MTFEDFLNIFSLFCTIVGLLFCLFKYIELPKRGLLYLVIFCLSRFFSDYYWAVYSLAMHTTPNASAFVAYLGWNVGYIFLLLAVLQMRKEGSKRLFHPLMLLPVITNVLQFFLYIQFGGLLNNIYQVAVTTTTMVLCMQQLLFYWKRKAYGASFPHLAALLLVYHATEYVMWTSTCFSWESDYKSPYFYCSAIVALLIIIMAWAAGMDYELKNEQKSMKSEAELRFQMLVQTIVSFAIFGGCMGGYFIVAGIRDDQIRKAGEIGSSFNIVSSLLIISVAMVVLVLLLLYATTVRYKNIRESQKELDAGKLSRFSFIFTIVVTLALMVFALIYNAKILYDSSVTVVNEDGEDKVKMVATDLENYLAVAETTLRVAADTVDLMQKNGYSIKAIDRYIVEQTGIQAEQFDENFTGIYALVDGIYIDGLNWVPPEGYAPMSRDWYKIAAAAGGEVVIVPPYVDAQTGSVVITIARSISDGNYVGHASSHNVVCLDVIVNHIQEVIEKADIAGHGYGLIVNPDGFIVAHHDSTYNGKDLNESYGEGFLEKIKETGQGGFKFQLGGEECSIFVSPIMDQWYAVIVVNNAELFSDVNSKLAVNILISMVTFALITFFYYLGYKNERNYGKMVEELNLQVVSALAAAIDAKDAYTNGHSNRVAKYSKTIAARCGYSKSRQDEIYMMGLLHDIGKIGVPVEVINKTDRLTDEEFEMIKKHPVIGSEILAKIEQRPKLAIGARWHHERYAGGGYPDGISGKDIPEEARIIAVADAYDAMTSRRSYRGVMAQEKVRAEVEKGVGTQFDPQFANIMLHMIDEDVDYTMHE